MRLSINRLPASNPPLIPNVNIDPAPFGKYFCADYNIYYPSSWDSLPRKLVHETAEKQQSFVLDTWRSTLRDNVSNPAKKKGIKWA